MGRALRLMLPVCLGLVTCTEYELHPVNVHPDEVTECPFVATAIPELFRYDCNPVFTATDEDWAENLWFSTFGHTEVAGHPFYQLWYVGAPQGSDDYSIGYALSDDGTDWTTHPENPGWPERGAGAWDGGTVQSLHVAWDEANGGYLMLYGGVSAGSTFFGAGLAGSYDGREWELSPNNPVMDFGLPIDGVFYSWPLTLDIRDGNYDAYFGGSVGDGPIDVYRVRTDDPENWTQEPSRVFRGGSDGAWDDEGFVEMSVVELDGVEYMFYVGFGEMISQGDIWYVDRSFVGLARKGPDDDAWSRVHDDPLPLAMTANGDVNMVAARVVGPRIHLWVQDSYGGMGGGGESGIGYFLYCPNPEDCEQAPDEGDDAELAPADGEPLDETDLQE